MSEKFEKLVPHLDKMLAFETALTLLQWDNETLAPVEALDNTAKVFGLLSSEYFNTMVNDDVKNLLQELSLPENFVTLEMKEQKIVKKMSKDFKAMECIPPEEYKAFSELIAKSSTIWDNAKEKNCFADFAPTLEEIVSYQKRFASYRKEGNKALYDIMLDDFEEGIDMKQLDDFFVKLRTAIVPLLKQVVAKNESIDKSYNSLTYDIEKQKEFCKYIAEYIGFDFNRGVIAESEHPFTTNLHNKDVRITTHYYENNLESSIFSTIHEGGHAIYEMNIDDSITQTPVGHGSSMGVHESQSRFFENIIGRSKDFWAPLWDRLTSTFPEQLKNVSLDQFILSINKAEPDFIRTEADELTYSLHIMIRYEIEKLLISGQIEVSDLPRIWNEKYEEYLGIVPPTDALGVLQDVHWSNGTFGYFPSYALGNAIASQIYAYLQTKIDFSKALSEGNLKPILDLLKEHIHQYGATKNTNELLLAMTGESFNADYYINYLVDKYTKLYQL
ncbi:carboxypeptidase M32 [Lachnoclostridium phytofermentans]|uniref:carboxypeptidase M32 n=1 Tax=Lachnoclostridium phytofermentans TaxID=66219 RepID=UPI0004961677|nr:carboxypeptidase M32 [Lachnoclostridium phytofermentans]